jgi:hypothetical protein
MGDMGEIFNAMRQHDKERRARNLNNFNPSGWNKHTEHHFSRQLNGKRLDYWPSRNRFMYDNRVMVGDVEGFIRNRTVTKGGAEHNEN